MSAFICTDKHIATIAVAYTRLMGNQDHQAQELANLLLEENIRSVNYRYRDNTEIEPCDISEHEADTRTPPEIVALCGCLAYQSCEHPQWDDSQAKKMLTLIAGQFQAAAAARGFEPTRAEGVWSI